MSSLSGAWSALAWRTPPARPLRAGLVTLALLAAGCSGPETHARSGRALASEDPACAHSLTAYPGDCAAPAPVDPTVALVAHYGPGSYDDPAALAEYVLAPGEEKIDCVYGTLGNASPEFYQRYEVHSRPGTHHVLLATAPPGIAPGTRDDCTLVDHGASRMLALVQGGLDGGVFHYPPGGIIAPENADVGTALEAYQGVSYQVHAVNATDVPLLREGWAVLYVAPGVTTPRAWLNFTGGLSMAVPPHSVQTIQNSCTWTGQTGIRVLYGFGHMHAHGQRLSAWALQRGASGAAEKTLVYETYDWSAIDLVQWDSLSRNVPVTYGSGVAGGSSGILRLEPGDGIDYECEMDNTEDFVLGYGTKVLSSEMCDFLGTFVVEPADPVEPAAWSCIGR